MFLFHVLTQWQKANSAAYGIKLAVALQSQTLCALILERCYTDPRSQRLVASSGCQPKDRLQTRKVAANVLNKWSQTADNGLFSSMGFRGLANSHSPDEGIVLRVM